jgi:MFS transporter, DHA2 family, multidrug resistance protein
VQPQVTENTGHPRRWAILGVLVVSLLVVVLDNTVLNVALRTIADPVKGLGASQTDLEWAVNSYTLVFAGLLFTAGIVGDRIGRRRMLLIALVVFGLASLASAYSKSPTELIYARALMGLGAAGIMPSTLSIISNVFDPRERGRAIGIWAGAVGLGIAIGPVVGGALLEKFWWGSVFLVTLPLAAVALVLAVVLVPAHVNESTEPVDNLGGILSIALVAALILAINFAPVPNEGKLTLTLALIAVLALVLFVLRQRRARNPLYDLRIAGRRIFWVAACAGIIVFGSLMGAAFVSQQYLQNVLGYSTLGAGAAILPAVVVMVLVAPRSAKLVETRGARFTLLTGYVFLLLAFGWMFAFWNEGSHYWQIGLAYVFIGIGVGFAGTPASHSLTGSVPVRRAGMASGTADLQRDLGGAIMQSIFGALLTAGYAAAVNASIAASDTDVTSSVQNELTKSFSSAADTAQQYPQYANQIIAGAKSSFLDGADWAYTAGIIAVLVGGVIVFFLFPRKDREEQLLAQYHAEDTAGVGAAA